LAGRYRIERDIGAGGMATVYLARDLKHDRAVAIKVLHPELAAVVGSERFLREIRVTAQLNHPHILPLIDSGEADNLLYYVTPYEEGESLRERLDREGQLPLDEALRITGNIADALGHAHSLGIIHRDIKPGNILFSGRHAVLADFGIAHWMSEADGERLTASGVAIGTAAYMSPEQVAGSDKVDGRSDVYSLGCVLYEMLAGEPPFTGPNAQAISARRLVDPVPSLRVVRDTVPAEVQQVVERALAKAPADRFVSAEEFAQALTGPFSASSEKSPRARYRAVRMSIGLAAVLAAIALVARVSSSGGGLTALPEGSSIAVIPLAPSSPDSALSRLGRDLVTTLSMNLNDMGDIRAASSQAVLARFDNPEGAYTLEESAALAAELARGV
jgi:serine/threonine-protein kinase